MGTDRRGVRERRVGREQHAVLRERSGAVGEDVLRARAAGLAHRVPDEHGAAVSVGNEIRRVAELHRATAPVEHLDRIGTPQRRAVGAREFLRPVLAILH